jgi:hypothetical protein
LGDWVGKGVQWGKWAAGRECVECQVGWREAGTRAWVECGVGGGEWPRGREWGGAGHPSRPHLLACDCDHTACVG